MIPKPNSCSGCPLFQDGQGFLQVEGTGAVPLMIVGESSGWHEKQESLPFRPNAPAGSVLHRIIQDKGKYNRSQFSIANMIFCQPFGDKLANTSYEYEAINHCRPNLDATIDRFKPKIILAIGHLPFKHLVGLTGKNTEISKVRGYVFPSSRYPGILVLPTFHSSFLRRGNIHLSGVLLYDFMKAVRIAQGKEEGFILYPFSSSSLDYKTEPRVEDALHFLQKVKDNPDLRIAYDIETDQSLGEEEDEIEEYGTEISQIQFSSGTNSGIALPWTEPFITIAKSILATSNPKCGHNVWDFDNPILLSAGANIQGRIDDSMWAFHHWQADLPRGLQGVASFYNFPFPWKHYASSNQAFYGIADVDSLHYIYNPLVKQLKDRGLWEGYERLVHNLKPILIKVQDRGLPINKEKQDSFRGEIEARQAELDSLFKELPSEFTSYHPTNGYVRLPKEINGIDQRIFVEKGRFATEEEIDREAIVAGYTRRKFPIEIEGNKVEVERWCKPLYFNANSSDQVSNYIKYKGDDALARKLAIKIAKEERKKDDEVKSKDNVSTSKSVLKALASKTGDVTYSYIIEYRELTKMGGTFLWEPKGDGRVHTTFGFATGSGQLTSRDYNIQQGPEHYTLAEKFKETIEAGEGRLLLKVDYRGYHNRMMGFLAEDEGYYRLASLDTHSYVTGHVVDYPDMSICLDLDDEYLGLFLSQIKKVYTKLRDDQVKHVVHGINFGLSEKGCYDRYGGDFNPSQEDVLRAWGTRKKKKPLEHNPKTGATYLQEEIEKQGKLKVRNLYLLLRELFPKIFKYQEQVLILASQQGFIDTPFGFRRWFPSASEPTYDRWGNLQGVKKGEQAEEALAFPVSNNAHCHLREGVIEADRAGLLDSLRMVNWVHDDLRFEIDQAGFEPDLMKLLTILERASNILQNKMGKFSCKADVQIGKNLKELRKWTL